MYKLECGHSCHDFYEVSLKNVDASGNREIIHQTVCQDCFDQLAGEGKIILTRKAAIEWLGDIEVTTDVSIIDLARSNIDSTDDVICQLARYIVNIHDNKNDNGYELYVSTGGYFTVEIADQKIHESGHIWCSTPDDVIIALDGARITKNKPIKLVSCNGEYTLDENETEHYRYFIDVCREAAVSILDYPNKDYMFKDALVQLKVTINHE
jgi:hypothetical protein